MNKTSGSKEFDLIRDALASDRNLRDELESALRVNLARVNPTDRANRFGSGAAVEWILASLAYSAGVITAPAGHNANGFDLVDLRDQSKSLWSVKNTTKKSDFRLSNGMGGAGKGFADPTIMLSPNLPGLVFAEPTIHLDLVAQVKMVDDATILPFKAVLEHATQNPECVAICKMPVNPGTGTYDPWMSYVSELLESANYPKLSKLFQESKPSQASVVEDALKLARMKEDGQITQQQFDALVSKLSE